MRQLDFKVHEESDEECNARFDPKCQKATDVADRYFSKQGVDFEKDKETGMGYTSVPVLQFLWGKPWNNMALNFCYSLRPSKIRVVPCGGTITLDCCAWRVTVYLEPNRRTISSMIQEAEVGLIGCRFGMDVTADPEYVPPMVRGGAISFCNPRAVARVTLKT